MAMEAPGGRVTLERSGRVGLIVIDNPPVNAGSAAVRRGLIEALAALDTDEALTAGLLLGAGRTFISGSDIREFGKPISPPLVPDVIAAIEASPKPIIAAISGAGLGGGFEIALACDARIALRDAVVGLPEVQLGLIPGAGGTQRLPRLVGLPRAIELVCSGRRVAAPEALELGMIDAIVEDLRVDGAAFALQLPGKNRLRDSQMPTSEPHAVAGAKETALKRARGLQSVAHALRALDLSLLDSIDEALKQERQIFDEIRTGEEASALRHLFFAGRAAAKRGEDRALAAPLSLVGVVGAGTMGSGIAVACLHAGYDVVLVDADASALNRAGQFVTRERLSPGAATISFVEDLDALARCDLIIEAIVEDMAAKSALLWRLATIAPRAVLASNTSYLNLDELAQASGRATDVVGLHFFNPAHRMKLLEIVKGAASSVTTLATAMTFGRRLGKVSVLSGVGEGFIGNRIYNAYRRHCEFLVADGAAPEQVDEALREFGFAMGPFAVSDMSGLDIAWRMRQRLASTRDKRERTYVLPDLLCAQGRFGRKAGAGWYVYDAESPGGRPDPHVAEMIARQSAESGVARRDIHADEILARALGAIINEAGLVLEDGIAQSAGDIDLVMVNGYGFPASKGGPLFWAGRQQPSSIRNMIDAVAAAQGFGFRHSSQVLSLPS